MGGCESANGAASPFSMITVNGSRRRLLTRFRSTGALKNIPIISNQAEPMATLPFSFMQTGHQVKLCTHF